MSPRPDFVLRSPDDRIVLVVEVKNRANATAEWAAQLRRNLAEIGALPSAPYFLLALPDKFFLWTRPSSNEAVPPDYEFKAETVLRPYAAKLSFPLNDLSSAGFQSLVHLWLEDLVRDGTLDPPRWLHASGLDEQLRDATVTARAAA